MLEETGIVSIDFINCNCGIHLPSKRRKHLLGSCGHTCKHAKVEFLV